MTCAVGTGWLVALMISLETANLDSGYRVCVGTVVNMSARVVTVVDVVCATGVRLCLGSNLGRRFRVGCVG